MDSPDAARQRQMVQADLALLQDPRVSAYLDTIPFAEGYFNRRPTEYNSREGDGYQGKRLTFDSFDSFPVAGGLPFHGKLQSAAGRYQITKDTYQEYIGRLGLAGFSP